jgi:hypothetical protein
VTAVLVVWMRKWTIGTLRIISGPWGWPDNKILVGLNFGIMGRAGVQFRFGLGRGSRMVVVAEEVE